LAKEEAFQKKTLKTQNTCEILPTGKKDCKCWLCKEEGHYASECPQKKSLKRDGEQIRIALSYGLIPLESYTEAESVYEYDLESSTSE